MGDWQIIYTKGAEQNLNDIYDHIAFSLLAPENAVGQVNRIVEAVERLAYQPFRFPLCSHEHIPKMELRQMPVDNYLVFYHVQESTGMVNVIRVMYRGRDVMAQLKRMRDE